MSDEELEHRSPTAVMLTDTAALEATICEVIARELELPIEAVRGTQSLRATQGMESLRLLRAVTKIEKHYEVELPDELVFDVDSISELAVLVRERLVLKSIG